MSRTPATFSRTSFPRGRATPAFTLIEILIVVTILGILAAIVVPNLTGATSVARENTLKDELRYLRTQVAVYRAQHRDIGAGVGGTSFLDQMTLYTDESGNTNATKTGDFRFGPYLTQMPANSVNQRNDIKFSTSANVASDIDDTTGWIYNVATLQILPNQSGVDSNGTPYSSY